MADPSFQSLSLEDLRDALGRWIDYEAAVTGALQLVPRGLAYEPLADDYAKDAQRWDVTRRRRAVRRLDGKGCRNRGEGESKVSVPDTETSRLQASSHDPGNRP